MNSKVCPSCPGEALLNNKLKNKNIKKFFITIILPPTVMNVKEEMGA
jgi:hypothetical protein